MQPIIVAHIIGRYLDAYLEMLSEAMPYQPLSAVLNNYLRMSEDGNTARIEMYARKLYMKIKDLELSEDPPFVIEHADGTKDVHKPDEIQSVAPELLKEALPRGPQKPIPVISGTPLENKQDFITFKEDYNAFVEHLKTAMETGKAEDVSKVAELLPGTKEKT